MPNTSNKTAPFFYWDMLLITGFIFIAFVLLPNLALDKNFLSSALTLVFNLGFNGILIALFSYGLYSLKKGEVLLKPFLNTTKLMIIVIIILMLFNLFNTVLFPCFYQTASLSALSQINDFIPDFLKQNSFNFLGFGFLIITKFYLQKQIFNNNLNTSNLSGNFGSASFASDYELKTQGYFEKQNQYVMGKHKNGQFIYLPLANKLTISPPGGGKTSVSSIPILLSYDGPTFVFDVKGELWATTAKYRHKILKRQVIVIDPYRITQQASFQKNKTGDLTKEWLINPFDFIPEEQRERDRMINAFAASFVLDEGGFATHFDENAKILIRGYIDYMMTLEKDSRNLSMLYDLMSEEYEQAEATFDRMSQLDGRAGAAANQIKRVGQDERGSILSTSYRQIDWMGDSNIQHILSTSNFDLNDFLLGNMDIYVVLPEDQIKEHHRLFRMILSLLMSLIVQASPNELPKQKMLFLFEELAQIGACPDVEQAIEVLRARGVVVWTVFQTLSQIEQFKKPDLFKGATIKQIFTNDDTKTMEWIQTLAGKRTANTKTISTNAGNSRHMLQTFGGTHSTGNSESVHETGVDLIPLNEIRELRPDEQLIFTHGFKPIRCEKTPYFKNPLFDGKWDENPLETKN